jgi:hypothetical protein
MGQSPVDPDAKRDPVPPGAVVARPTLADDRAEAEAKTAGSPRWRLAGFGLVLAAALAWLGFGTVTARNVYFNVFVDEGRYNGIPRFTRETVVSVWSAMWDRTPDFGSIDLTRAILFGSVAAFVVAAVAVVYLVLVPSERDWSDGLGSPEPVDRVPGD